jgi:predicted DNA-binding transcriptional regulator AlpA
MCNTGHVTRRRFYAEDLVDVHDVAEILGMANRTSVSTYQLRFADFPPPVINLGERRIRLWARADIEKWARERTAPPGGSQDRGRQARS